MARAYGVPRILEIDSRVTFLIGSERRILRAWPNVDPGVHADHVLAAAHDAEKAAP